MLQKQTAFSSVAMPERTCTAVILNPEQSIQNPAITDPENPLINTFFFSFLFFFKLILLKVVLSNERDGMKEAFFITTR